MDDLFIVDAHEDIAFHINYFERDFINPDIPCMITLPGLIQAGVRLVFNTIFVHPKHRPDQTVEKAKSQVQIYEDIFFKNSDNVSKILNSKDLDQLMNNNKIGFITLMEGADPKYYFDKGMRILGPAWNNKNRYASGHETDSALSDEGKQLINEMNKLGITLDLSHLNEKCFWDAINITELIPIATHSNSRTLTDHPRNLYDDQLLAISEKGGVTGIVFYNTFLKTGKDTPSLEDIFKHTDYIINLCGEDHVGIGTDLDGGKIEEFPKEMQHISSLPAVAKYFLEKGYSEERVRKIMGNNFLRVLKSNLGKP